jgi:formate hydrogenlyase subunit 4
MTMLQPLLILVLAPLLQGTLRFIRARLSGRPGPPPWQPYRDLAKLWKKEALIPDGASTIVLAAPGVAFGVALTFVCILPPISASSREFPAYDAVALALLIALGRFVLVLAALDTRSAFEAMAVGREIAFAALTEAPLILVLAGGALAGDPALSGLHSYGIARGTLAGVALVLVMLSETARVPVDNQETHYELTMIHEGLLLEYAGWHLAILQMTSYLRQAAFFVLIALLVAGTGIVAFAWIVGLALLIPTLESVQAKLRLFEVPQIFSSALLLAMASLGLGMIGGLR